jgi:hypothetical protein
MVTSQIYPLELFDETLDINATENYDLILELSGEGVSIALLDLLRGKYVMLRHYPHEIPSDGSRRSLAEIIASDDFLSRRYRKVIIITPTLLYTLVPAAVYDPALKDDYFRFNHTLPENGTVVANTLPFPDAVALFTPDRETMEVISSHWHDIIPWHHTKPLLNHVFSACRSSDDRYLHVHFEQTFITIIIVEKRNLVFCNSFECTSIADVGYFLFNVLDKRGVSSDETIYISGSLEPYSERHIALLNFAENIRFTSPIIRQSFSYVMNEVHLHRWLNLFTAPSCES